MVRGEASEIRAAHSRYYAGREADILDLWDRPRQREAYTWFTTELANLRTAFRWAADWVSPETVEGSSMLPPAGWQRSSRTRPAAATRRSYGDGGCCRSRSTRPSQPLVPGPWW